MFVNNAGPAAMAASPQPGSAARNCRIIKKGGGCQTGRDCRSSLALRLQSYSNLVVDSYSPGMAKRGSTIIILLLVLVLLVIGITAFLGFNG